jgi:hypothetical protein
MRQPATTSPATSSAALATLIAAVPIERLRALVLELMLNGASAATLELPTPTPPAKRLYRRRSSSRPPGRRRGRTTIAAKSRRRRSRKSRPELEVVDPKLIARRKSSREHMQRKRAAAKAAKAAAQGSPIGNGNAPGKAPEITAVTFWQHAETLTPTKPWRAVARELGTNEAQALDCYREGKLIPGLTAHAIERFLALAPP